MTAHPRPPTVAQANEADAAASRTDTNDAIRAAYLSQESLGEIGAELARAKAVRLPGYRPFEFISRQTENQRAILAAYRSTVDAVRAGEMITPAAEWLADNYYLIEETIQEVRRDLPLRFYRQLPRIEIEGAVSMPRALALAWLFVAHGHSSLTRAKLSALIEGYQSVETLKIGELWAIPSILRFVLVENLRRISEQMERARIMRLRANQAADRLLLIEPGQSCAPLLADITAHSDDNAFAAQLLYRLRDGSQTSKEALAWLEERLEARGSDAEEVLVVEHNRLSAGNATIGDIIRSLRDINDIDWTLWFEEMSRVDRVLADGSDFAALDFASRDLYRKAVERLARRSACSEIEVAQAALSLAAAGRAEAAAPGMPVADNIGFYLVGGHLPVLEAAVGYRPKLSERLHRWTARRGWLAVAVPVVVLTLLVMAAGAWFLVESGVEPWTTAVLVLLFAVPASEAANGLYHALAPLVLRPTRLVGYEYRDGVPEEARTLIAVPCLLTSRDGIDELLRALEVHHLANARGALSFALVSDWTDDKVEHGSADAELLDYAKEGLHRLNARYESTGRTLFHILHRRRLFNEAEGVWMGWERKRGKLHELNLLLRGDKDTTFLPAEPALPRDIRYVMTLDADTRLTRDAVNKLVGKLAHPTNRAVIDPRSGLVRAGYGILQPRVTPSLTTGQEASAFQRIFSVDRGLDPYVFTVSDLYQDLLGEGTFTGKGLYDIDAFEAAIKGRIAENTVLSHDLLEGSLARCGLATDVELIEDFPTRYEVEVSRQHRWARGDWQLLPYIAVPKRGVPMIGRWKMIDNLRRSLTPIAWIFATVLGWCVLTSSAAAVWQIILIFSLFVAPTVALISGSLPRRRDIVARAHVHSVLSEINAANAQVALRIIFIAHTAWVMGDAIVRTLYRLFVSRRRLLEWRTAAQVQSGALGGLADYYRAMWQAPAIGVAALALAGAAGSQGVFLGLAFAACWLMSPAVAWWVSQSAETEDRLHVSAEAKQELRTIARRTWRYFETFVTEENNHLPPDNVQEDPSVAVAHRTSPTNIGVYALAIVSARDFGWISLSETVDRIERTAQTVERMDKHRGHLFNWYETRSLEPLHPKYVSSVDSGNLAGHLIAVSSACAQWAEAPSAYLFAGVDGIADVALLASESLAAIADDRRTVRPLRRRVEERLTGFHRAVDVLRREPEFASIRTINLSVLAREIEKLADGLHHEVDSHESGELVYWCQALCRTCEAHVSDAMFEPASVERLRQRLIDLRERTRNLAFSMDFGFLLRKDRRLLSIGHRVDAGELDEACYDLLASEARLTSLFGIAKGDLPTEHWFRLGRPVVPVGSLGALVSWSGSMFEYLMPPLVMKEQRGGILNQSNNLAVKRQIRYGRELGIPWGISEAAFNARDQELTYQYSNFGVPALGLKRGLGRNAVIAPYASLLASQYQPDKAIDNLRALRALGALGLHGYYDAVDFTPTRVPEGEKHVVVKNYMAHHQGMSIAAVANVVFNGRLRDLFHSDPVIEAAELLLQEKAPRDVPILTVKREPEETGAAVAELEQPAMRVIGDPVRADRATLLLSNGHYSVMLTATGSGVARWNGLAVTRWRPDPTEDHLGTFIFLRDMASNEWWSATGEPRRAVGEESAALFSDDKAEFHKTVGTLRSEVEVVVATDHDAEARRVTLFNTGKSERFVEVTSYAELVIAAEDTDIAHPMFAKMFVRTEIGPDRDVIRAERQKRGLDEPDMHIAHLVCGGSGTPRGTQAETDRRAFIGRGRCLAEAAAFDPDAKLSGSDGFTLDPIVSLRRVVRIPPGKKASLVFWTIAAPSRAEVDAALERYCHVDSFQHEAVQAWTRSQVQLRFVGISHTEAASFQTLARYLIYPDLQLGAESETVRAGLASQSALWPLAISGDFPIFVLRINDSVDIDIARKALRAQEYLRARGLTVDLVIVNERDISYAQDLQNALEALCENARLRGQAIGPRQHIFAVRRDLMDQRTYDALIAAARVVLHARNGKLADQIDRAVHLRSAVEPGPEPGRARDETPKEDILIPPQEAEAQEEMPLGPARIDGNGLEFWNGYGGFAEDGHEYVVRLRGGEATPQPWINVMSNGDFGTHIAAEGAAFSWSRNSRDYQLTPWTNDPVINRPGEAFFITDLTSGQVSTPFAGLSREPSHRFEARHGLGYSRFSTRQNGLAIDLVQTVDLERPLKYSRIRIGNQATTPVRLRVYGYAEWVLGSNRARTAPFIVAETDPQATVLMASNRYSIDFSDRTAFFTADRQPSSFTADRRAFLGNPGTILAPRGVFEADDLSGSLEITGDPCAALACDLEIAAGKTEDVTFILGDAAGRDAAMALAEDGRRMNIDAVLDAVRRRWHGFAGTLAVDTPDRAMNHLVNVWLPYQGLSCRILARSAFYQASGAYGFRDQLQDTLAFLLHDPALARTQILNAAGRQFVEGDVQHWWLPASGSGVRTLISDDVVWLAYAVAHYCRSTGDDAVLREQVAFLEGDRLEDGQHDAFFRPDRSSETGTVFEHCARALDLAVRRTGANGLPLILGGDWNDGMNRVGAEGRGESVWLGWFLLKTLADFIPLAEMAGDKKRVTQWRRHIDSLKTALDGPGWDGSYWRRGYYDDGTPLGSSQSDSCRIDSIAQSWSVMSGQGPADKSGQAMQAVLDQLVDGEGRLIKLFTPPFEAGSKKDPGYIKGYPPGVRENGGQYTHAATWVVYALAEMGRGDEAYRCFNLLNPITHALDREAAERYRVEPYVAAADVYGEGGRIGRGGWTWYTGSGGWLYRAAVEGILGLRREGDRLTIRPALPSDWPGYSASLTIDGHSYRIEVGAADGDGRRAVAIDGQAISKDWIALVPANRNSLRKGSRAKRISDSGDRTR